MASSMMLVGVHSRPQPQISWHEALDDALALARVRDLGVELHAVEAARLVGDAGERGVVGLGDDAKAVRERLDPVAVAHPDVEQAVALGRGVVLDVAQQPGVPAGAHLRIAVLALGGRRDAAAELRGHGLHAIADAEHRHAEIEHERVCPRRLGLVHRLRAAGENDPARRKLADQRRIHVPGMQLAVDAGLAHAPGNELRVLGAEVEDQEAVGMNICWGHCGSLKVGQAASPVCGRLLRAKGCCRRAGFLGPRPSALGPSLISCRCDSSALPS
jgi:hypothetical protein